MSLVIPDHFYINNIIALDPGADTTGIAIISLNFKTGELLRIETHTLYSKKLSDPDGLDPEVHSERDIKLSKLYHALQWFFHKHRPVGVASEAPFFYVLAPMAYGSLTEVVSIVKRALVEYNINLSLSTYPPLTVKQGVGAKTVKKDPVANKLAVRVAIEKIEAIMKVITKPLDQMTEHEIDAIAVGYKHISTLELS